MQNREKEIHSVLDVVAQQYKVEPALLRQPISTLSGNPAREALVHAFYILKLRDVPFSQIANVTQNYKGTISRTIDKEIGGRIATARIHTNMHLAEQRKHKEVCEAVRAWEAEQAEQESYFDDEQEAVQEIDTAQTSEDSPTTEVLPTEPLPAETTPLPAETPVLPTAQSTQKVVNPIFQKVVDQNAKVIPTGNLQEFTNDFGLPEDDGVPEPKTPKNTGGQPSPFPNPTDASAQVVTPNSNTAQFATNIAKNILPLAIVPLTQIDEIEVEELEDANRLPTGALDKIEKQNKLNAQKIKNDIELQINLVNEPLARALGSAGVGSHPMLELVIALVVMLGMLAMTIFSMRSNNHHLVERMKREHRKQQKLQQMQEAKT